MTVTVQPQLVEADPRVPAPNFAAAPCRKLTPKAADELSFPDRMSEKDTVVAKALCEGCPQATNCLLYVLANPRLYPDGVWAATTPNERERLREGLRERLGDDWVSAALRTRRTTSTSPRTSGSRRPVNHTHLRAAACDTLVVVA